MRRAIGVLVATWVMLLLASGPASAHPLGNFTINRFSALEISTEQVRVHYVVDMAEVPTFQELARVGLHPNASDSALQEYADATGGRLARELHLRANGDAVDLDVTETSVRLSEGQGGLHVLRTEVLLIGRLSSATAKISYSDENYRNRVGWAEVIAYPVDGQGLRSSSVPTTSTSDALRSYPKDLLSSPLQISEATLALAPGASATGPPAGQVSRGDREIVGEWFSSLITRDISPAFLVAALVLALGAGALHALGPGHGKSIMAAYLVGAEGSARHVCTIGLAVSLMHTVSVVALGLITLWASNVFPPDRIYPWLSLVSGLVVLGLGLWLLRARVRTRRARPLWGRDHHHGHDHDHAHDHHHHGPRDSTVSPLSWKGLAALALSGGLLPSPSALVVLLGAVALHRVAFGLVLVAAFSVGLAGALILIGVLVLRARDFATRRFGARTMAVMPLLSAAAILSIGLLLTTRAAIGL